jgi:UV DNA damage repair endonuclease
MTITISMSSRTCTHTQYGRTLIGDRRCRAAVVQTARGNFRCLFRRLQWPEEMGKRGCNSKG